MKRKVFYSFHFKPDKWRVSQVRNIGAIEGNQPASDNDWEAVKKKGDGAIRDWIDNQLKGRSCTVVLIGEKTAGRKWIKYEIKKSWEAGKGVVGIYIHNLEDNNGEQSEKGKNPFEAFKVGDKPLNKIVKAYDPPYKRSKNVYSHIAENVADWIQEAINIRNQYPK